MTTPADEDAEPIGNDGGYRRRRLPPWAIVVHTIWANPKVRRAGPTATLVFVYALTQNAEHGRGGTFPAEKLEVWFVADMLRLSEPEAAVAIDRAIEARLIAREGDQIVIVGWDEDFARRALTAAESAARMRRRSRAPRSETKTETKTKIRTENKNKRNPAKSGHGPDNVRTRSGSTSRSTGLAQPEPEVTHVPQIAQAAPDVIGNQRQVDRFVGLVNAARQRVAKHHGFEDDHPINGAIVGDDGLTLLRLLRKSADPDRDLAKVIAVTEADARHDVDKLRFLGWSIVRGHSWETKLGAAPPGSSNRSVFDVIDAVVDAGDL